MSERDEVEYWLRQALVSGNVDPEVTRLAVQNALDAYLKQEQERKDEAWGEAFERDILD